MRISAHMVSIARRSWRGDRGSPASDVRRPAFELEPRRFPHPDRCVQLLQPDGTAAHGLRQSGPRPVFSLGTLIIAAGPALCSPLKGVGCVTSKPQDLAL